MGTLERQDKRKLILDYVIPALGVKILNDEHLIEDLVLNSRFTYILKYQQIEIPGSFEDANVWFSIDAMIHSYYFCPDKLVKKGTRIWKKREIILFTSCLLEKKDRTDYLEALESGIVIFIKYIHLIELLERYPNLEKSIKLVSINNERCYHNRSILLNKPPIERVKQLITENRLFVIITSRTVQAMHVNLTRNGYDNQLKRIHK